MDAESFILMYLQRQPVSVHGWNILAGLLETRRSYKCAEYSYQMALTCLRATGATLESSVGVALSQAILRCQHAVVSISTSSHPSDVMSTEQQHAQFALVKVIFTLASGAVLFNKSATTAVFGYAKQSAGCPDND